MKLLLVFVIISALIFPIAASADSESESSNSDELFELELIRVLGGPMCLSTSDPSCLFMDPTDIAIGESGNIYVADYRRNQIQILDSVGQLIQTIKLKGLPHGITLDKYENIYVTEWWDWFGVEKFTKADEPSTFSHLPWPADDFQIEDQSVFGLPSDIAIDSNGILYVLEHRNLDIDYGKNAGVHKLSADGSYLEFIRIPETAITNLSKFGLMTMDKAGYLYLLDHRVNNIIEMDPSNGDVRILDFYHTGTEPKQKFDFDRPNGIAFNQHGFMFISEQTDYRKQIYIFDEYHQLVGSIGEYGLEDGKISNTHGLEFDKDGNMYVVDYGEDKVQVFHIASEVFGESISEETEEPSMSDASSQPACGQGTVLKNGVCVVEESKSGGGCLIATATFGSEMAPQVQFLREIRDNTVLQTESGISFMTGFNQFYYSFSPVIADYERENPVFKEVVKLTLTPLLTSLTLLQYTDIDSESEMLGYGIGIILLNIGMYFIAPAVVMMKIRSFYKLQ